MAEYEQVRFQAARAWPDWLAKAVEADLDPWCGAYSYVFPIDEKEVVKLVWEPGALAYLRMCQTAGGALPHLPMVTEVLTDVAEFEGRAHSAVRMERLRSGGTAMDAFADEYALHVRSIDDGELSNVILSAYALRQCAQQWRTTRRTLSACLLLLADEVETNDWAADMGNDENWMIRPRDGVVVLSDPVHGVEWFADDLV
ncbi:hypothetical protein [Burkholderia cenocepacia]|uniref:hypothetical protein n=1 Tax=Burkholderia cenocepacia TaxID=95486 RepID=UPI000760FEB2|nr:hypothetical protein [Burkholderia cenocepacia]KWU17900.1 hypothetical protein AS149_14590 [Burkholderia cenocepacia]